jgi:hypothetical protein
VIVDAVANAPDIVGSHVESDGGAAAAYAGEGTSVTTTLHFDDMSGREIHYAVLQQGQFIGKADNVWLCDQAFINGQPAEIVLVFDQSQKPYYAVVVPAGALGADGNVDVTWHVTAPNISQDANIGLKMGGISVEPGTGVEAGHKELTLDNNWAETIQPVYVRIGMFDTTEVRFNMTGELVENDGAAGVAIHLQAPAAATNEIITQTDFTFTQNGAKEGDVIGTVWYKGEAHEVVVGGDGKGHLTLEFGSQVGEGYDPKADFRFTATDAEGNSLHNSNPISVDTNSTVRDVYLGEERSFGDHQVFNVIAVADAPTDVGGTGPTDAAGSGDTVVVTVSASFVDVDGSEKHYVLVEAKPGWTCNEPHTQYTGPDGVTYFRVEVDGAATDVTKDISLTTPKDYVLGDHTTALAVGGLAVEQAAGSINNGFTPGGSVTVDIHDTATLTLLSNNPAGGVAEGGELSFTLTLANGAQPFTAGEDVSVTLSLTGVDAATAAQLPAGWTAAGDGSFHYTLVLPAGANTADVKIPVGTDNVLGHTATENMRVEVIDQQVPASLADNVAVGGASFVVPILDADRAYLSMEAGDTTLVSGDVLNFDLHLRNPQGEDTSAAMAIMAAFRVSNDAGDFVPDAPLNTEIPDGHGNTLVWTQSSSGDYVLTATLAPGNSTLHIELDVKHTQDKPGFIDSDQTLHLHLQGVSGTDGKIPTGLDAKIHTGDDDNPLQVGGHVEFNVVDADYAQHADSLAQHGISQEEALGKEVVNYNPDQEYTGAEGDHGQGQVILGTDGHDVIYATQGNDILVGGDGNDTFVWNNLNMGQSEQSLDIIKDFTKGDSLRFDDLLAEHGEEAQSVLSGMIDEGQWHANEDGNGGTFITEHESGASIHLSVAETAATLTVSYHHEGQQYTQNVELQNFDASEFHSESALDHAAVAEMLKEIIQTGGSV